MTVQAVKLPTSYPGVYVQEIASSSHTIQPATTSDTVFIGFAHPFKTDPSLYGIPQLCLSASDYTSHFGNPYAAGPYFRDYLGQAVRQFFLNGGSVAWVIALEPPLPIAAPTAAGLGSAALTVDVLNAVKEWLDTAKPENPEPALVKKPEPDDSGHVDPDKVAAYEAYVAAQNYKVLEEAYVAYTATTGTAAAGAPARSKSPVTPAAVLKATTDLVKAQEAISDTAAQLIGLWRTELARQRDAAVATFQQSTKEAQAADPANEAELSAAVKKAQGDQANLTKLESQLAQVTTVSLTAKEPVLYTTDSRVEDPGVPMTVSIVPTVASNSTIADIVIRFGARSEVYRGVKAKEVGARLATSQLVSIDGTAETFVAATDVAFTYAPEDQNLLTNPGPDAHYVAGEDICSTGVSAGRYSGIFDPPTSANIGQGVARIENFNLMCLPGTTGATAGERAILQQALACCEDRRAFLIVDTPAAADNIDGDEPIAIDPTNVATYVERAGLLSTNGALYFPHLHIYEPVNTKVVASPPCGFVAGIYARTDVQRGVFKTPAGQAAVLNGLSGGVVASGRMSNPEQGRLNPHAINCIRNFGPATVVYGGRTLAGADSETAFEQYRYVAVRRFTLFLENSLYSGLQWAVFEPNAQPLWTSIRISVNAFMLSLFKQGAFAGTTPSTAFQVVCDETTTSVDDVANGTVNVLVGFAPLKPAEFVVIQIAQMAGQQTS